MPSPANVLPVYSADNEILYNAPLATVPRLIDRGLVSTRGTKNRVRALIARCGIEELRAARPPVGHKFSHKHETDQNPAGVWTFYKLDAA